jgi:hypothetical protein
MELLRLLCARRLKQLNRADSLVNLLCITAIPFEDRLILPGDLLVIVTRNKPYRSTMVRDFIYPVRDGRSGRRQIQARYFPRTSAHIIVHSETRS